MLINVIVHNGDCIQNFNFEYFGFWQFELSNYLLGGVLNICLGTATVCKNTKAHVC